VVHSVSTQQEDSLVEKQTDMGHPFFRVFAPFSRRILFRVNCLLLPLVALTLFAKFHKYAKLSGRISFGDLYSLFRVDLLFLLSFGLLFLFWLDRVQGRLRNIGIVALHVMFLFAMLITLMEHSFFLVTGTIGDWMILQYTLLRFRMLWDMLWSQMTFSKLLLVNLIFLLALLPLFLERVNFVKVWIQKERQPHPLHEPFVGIAIFLFLAVLALFPPKDGLVGNVRPLARNVLVGLMTDIVQSAGKSEPKKASHKGKKRLFDTRWLRFKRTSKTKRMNVVVIVLESTRARSTTVFNKKLQTTPFLNKLAQKSLLVEQIYATYPHTSKALVAILCGIPPKITMKIHESQRYGLPARCLPKLLGALGYQTAFFQTATLHFEGRQQLTKNMGYQFFRSFESLPKKRFKRLDYLGYEDMMMFKPSLRWLDRRKKNKPFLLTYLTLASHHAYRLPSSFPKKKYIEHNNHQLNDYLNTLRYTDGFLERVFAEFKKRGLMDSTLFVVLGDHGEAFYEHKRKYHDNGVWEEMLRIPALIHNPVLFPKGRRIKGLRSQMDILPTIAEILGLKFHGGYSPGRSLLSTKGHKGLNHSCWYTNYCMGRREGDFKYIYHFGRMPGEVYNLKKDPLERNNLLSKNKGLAKRWRGVKKELLRWRNRVNAIYENPDLYRINKAISLVQPKVQVLLNVRFGPYIRLVGYTLHTETVKPGQKIELTLVFQALKKVPKGWKFFFHGLLSRPKRRFLNINHLLLAGMHPLQKWIPGQYITEHFRYRLSVRRVQSGQLLHLRMGMWKKRKGRQPVRGAHGRPHQKASLLLAEIPIR